MFKQIMEKDCQKCGSPTNYKEGFSKAKNKAWKGYFCQNPDCKEVEWVRDTPQKPQNAPTKSFQPKSAQDPIKLLADEIVGLRQEVKEMISIMKGEIGQ